MATLLQTVRDWYWYVGDTFPTTKAYSSRQFGFVLNSDALLLAWLTNGLFGERTNITAIVANGSGKCRCTVGSTAKMLDGQYVNVNSVLGTTEVNGNQVADVINATTVDFPAVAFVNPYVSGGYVQGPTV